MKKLILVAPLILLSACSAHSPMILKTTTDFERTGGASTVRSGSVSTPVNSIVVTDKTFTGKTTLGQIDVGTVWYGSCAKAYKQMAIKASEVGANAVENATCWKQPSGFSWAPPHASGQAVIVRDTSQLRGMPNLQHRSK
jgi:hypothetical protein